MEENTEKRKLQPLRNSDLIRDSRQLFIFKKTEKIVSAIFLISESFSHGVPQLSIQMREHAMNLLKKTLAVKSLIHFEVHEVESLIKDYLFLRSLFAVAHQTRLISDTNFSIVEFEMAGVLARLRSIIETPLSDSQSDVLQKDFFSIEEMFSNNNSFDDSLDGEDCSRHSFDAHHDHADPNVSFIGHDLYKGHIKDKQKDPINKRSNTIQDNQNKKNKAQKNSTTTANKNNGSKESRLKTITDLLSIKGESSIRDIYDQFSGISEKTIQRDLQTLVAKGVVHKEGEKRWSTYQLSR